MSRGKIRFAALISAIFVLFINICAFAKVDIPNHTDRFFINDYANVIDSETEDYIFEKGKAYNAQATHERACCCFDNGKYRRKRP